MNCKKCGCILPEGVTCCPSCGTFAQTQPTNQMSQEQILQKPGMTQQTMQQTVNQIPQQPGMMQQSIQQTVNQIPGMTQQPIQQTVKQIPQQPGMTQQPVANKSLFPGQGMTVQNKLNNQQTNSQSTYEEEPKKKKNIFKILILLIIVAAAGVFLYPKIKSMLYKPEISDADKLYETTSFWLRNTEGKWAIFDINGKQLTDFIYTEVREEFVNNTAMVKNDKNQYAIITSLGKELIKFGKYEKIKDVSAGYIAQTADNKNFLYNRAGQLIKELGSNPIAFGYKYGLNGYGSNLYVGIFDNNEFTIINYAGEELLKFPYVENEYTIDKSGEKISPKIDLYDDKYLSVFYNQHNYIINMRTKEKIIDFESPLEFNVASANEEKNEIFLKSVSKNSGWNRDESEIFEYKLIRNNEVVYTKTHEEEIDEVLYNNGVLEFYAYQETFILNEEGEKIQFEIGEGIAGYTDYNNYIKSNKNRNKEVYVNNELKQAFNCLHVETSNNLHGRYAKHGIYVLKECAINNDASGSNDELYDEYDENKNVIIKPDGTILNDKIYYYISDFDEFGNLTVSEDGKTEYLINSSGEKISKDYYFSEYDAEWENRISQLYFGDNEFFVARKDEYNEVIFDKNGKEYITANSIHEVANELSKDVFVILEYDDYYTVYNVTKQKEILKSKEDPDCNNGYIMISQDGKMEFYSYITGKLFYTIEKK